MGRVAKWVKPFSANFTKWSNTLKQFVRNLPTNCLSVFDHFVGLALKELRCYIEIGELPAETLLWALSQACPNLITRLPRNFGSN